MHLYGAMLRANPQDEQETFLGFVPAVLALVAVVFALVTSPAPSAHAPSTVSTGRRIATVLLAVAAATQFFGLMSVALFGGFNVGIAGLRLRATTPVRLTLQFLVAFGLLLAVSRRARVEAVRVARSPVAMFALMATLAVGLSFGPNYGMYGFLYDYVPGFNSVRVPARYAMIAGLFLAILAGFGARVFIDPPKSGVLSNGRTRLVVAAIAILILVEGAAIPIEINRVWCAVRGAAAGARLSAIAGSGGLRTTRGPARRHGRHRVPIRRRWVGDSLYLLRGGSLETHYQRLQWQFSAGV